ncbi:MAG: exodeoxyribonuclease VII small subunit [Ruminococcaceae bacterium]|nr:exodeoxyribonuclease VII small subunit [Oscillospiraceae bacterium]
MENSFEKSLNQLEDIINKLENEDVSLDESIALFEKGVKLSNDCRKTLETAEQKIISLTEAESEE